MSKLINIVLGRVERIIYIYFVGQHVTECVVIFIFTFPIFFLKSTYPLPIGKLSPKKKKEKKRNEWFSTQEIFVNQQLLELV